MEASGRFRFVREVLLHGVEEGDAARLIGTAYSLGPLTVLLADGVGEGQLGLAALKARPAESWEIARGRG
jgi:hypothetical protein